MRPSAAGDAFGHRAGRPQRLDDGAGDAPGQHDGQHLHQHRRADQHATRQPVVGLGLFELSSVRLALEVGVGVDRVQPGLGRRAGFGHEQTGGVVPPALQAERQHPVVQRAGGGLRRVDGGAMAHALLGRRKPLDGLSRLVVALPRGLDLLPLPLGFILVVEQGDGADDPSDDVHRRRHALVLLDLDVVVGDDAFQVALYGGQLVQRGAGGRQRHQQHQAEGRGKPRCDSKVCHLHGVLLWPVRTWPMS
jgi:hypothetical protein